MGSKIWTYFRRLRNSIATLSANISGVELDSDNRETDLETTKVPYIVPKLKFGPLTAKTGPPFSHTLRNHHLLGRGGHHVGLPLRAPTFLVIL